MGNSSLIVQKSNSITRHSLPGTTNAKVDLFVRGALITDKATVKLYVKGSFITFNVKVELFVKGAKVQLCLKGGAS